MLGSDGGEITIGEMIDTDPLFTIAELAVTMVAVSGLVTVFLSRGSLGPADKARFMAIVVTGIHLGLLAFVPIWVFRYTTEVTSAWQSCSTFALASVVFFGVLGYSRENWVLARRLYAAFSLTFAIVVTIVVCFNILLMGMNAFSWPFQSNATLYEIALYGVLFQIALVFLSLVIHRIDEQV